MKANNTLTISILSGKGGVGKTNIALNLGYCMYRGGFPVMLMDCDLGLANLDVLLGVTPDTNMQSLLDTDTPAAEVAFPIEPDGFDFLPAASGVPELVEMDSDLRSLLFQRLNPLFSKYEYLLMDLGAGITPTVLAFAAMTRIRVVVVTPEPTSLTDSYALMKVLSTQHNVKDFYIIVNQAEDKSEETGTYNRLATACERFLGFTPEFLGGIRQDKMVPESVRKQTPLMKHAPNSRAAKDIFAIAVKLQKIKKSMLEDISKSIFRESTSDISN
ncbi:MinD/ParA family protein [Halodesulfovibrio aestuarii]|uniref:Flagellar biosynthesis protein FlhG n=1 Tax=Halodesulfovibrio aestuarii TaxID=126333 RepID=A0A8G2C8D0_9BACT|nr:MinD/ParA family protein [Halodesulfovibrio aestuarii]SHI79356.1 flagellar biosynthesis protein FlhG [Halodesulfovibrio aestuarii]